MTNRLAIIGWMGVLAAVNALPADESRHPNPLAGGPRVLTLAQARDLAFANNWDLLAAKSDVDLAAAQKIVARQFPNPTLSLGTAKISADTAYGSSTPAGNAYWNRSYDTVVAINQLFEIGGKRASRRASAEAGQQAAAARLADARRLLDQAVTRAYVSALLAETNGLILRESAASLRREERIAEVREKAGDISRADKSQIEMAADRLELDAKSAETAATQSRIALEVLLGAPCPQGTTAPGDSLHTLAGSPLLSSVSTPGALSSRPDFVAAEAWLRKADADVRLAKAQRVPDPTVLVQYEHEPPDQPNTIGVGLSFPLPLWNRNKGGIDAARAARDQAALQLEKIKAQIAADIVVARTSYADATERWRRQRDVIQPKSASIRETVAFAYEKGGASLLDLLSAERNNNDVRLATAQAAADTAVAAANLKAALNWQEGLENQGHKAK